MQEGPDEVTEQSLADSKAESTNKPPLVLLTLPTWSMWSLLTAGELLTKQVGLCFKMCAGGGEILTNSASTAVDLRM